MREFQGPVELPGIWHPLELLYCAHNKFFRCVGLYNELGDEDDKYKFFLCLKTESTFLLRSASDPSPPPASTP